MPLFRGEKRGHVSLDYLGGVVILSEILEGGVGWGWGDKEGMRNAQIKCIDKSCSVHLYTNLGINREVLSVFF